MRAPYSYRADATVPPIDDSYVIAVMDGDCALCSYGARFIAGRDRKQKIKICPIQSTLGQALARHYGIDPHDPDSWMLLKHGTAYTEFDGFIETGKTLGGIWRLGQSLRILPRSVKNWLYHRIARNRYALFGHTDMCALPDPNLRARLLTD